MYSLPHPCQNERTENTPEYTSPTAMTVALRTSVDLTWHERLGRRIHQVLDCELLRNDAQTSMPSSANSRTSCLISMFILYLRGPVYV
jgi:hypothetical protein